MGLDRSLREKFWKILRELLQGISQIEKLPIGGYLNDHVDKKIGNYSGFHGGCVFGERNEEGKPFSILL